MKRFFSILAILGLTACGAHHPVPVSAPVAPPAPPPPSAPAPEPEAPKPSALSLLRAEAEQCAYGEMIGFEPDCPGFIAWSDNKALFEDGSANAMLVEMLTNPRAKVRYLAAQKLYDDVPAETVDAQAANAIIDAGADEKSHSVSRVLGHAAGRLPLAKLGVLDHAIAIARSAPESWYTASFVYSVGHTNADPKLLAYAKELATSSDDTVLSSDLTLLGALTATLPEACTTLDGLRNHPSTYIASSAAGELVSSHHCPRFYSGVLSTLSKQTAPGKTVSFSSGMVLDELCSDPALAPADRAKAGPLAKKIAVSKTASASTRAFALRAAVSCDAKGGKAFAGKLKHDKNELVAKTAVKLASAD